MSYFLHNYLTGDFVRPATATEYAESQYAAEHKDGGAGVIETADVHRAYVIEV